MSPASVLSIRPGPVGGLIATPPSKSVSHRLLICAALAQPGGRVANIGSSDDILATVMALQHLGAVLRPMQDDPEHVEVEGIFTHGAETRRRSASGSAVDCRSSASTLRFTLPLFALLRGNTRFTGEPRLFERPLAAFADLFARHRLPFHHQGNSLEVGGHLKHGHFELDASQSSQFASGMLYALPLLEGDSVLRLRPPVVSRSYIELTRHAQARFGVVSHWVDEHTLNVPGGQHYRCGQRLSVEGDWCQAAVPLVLGALAGPVSLSGLSAQSVQGDQVILDILDRCGAEALWKGDLLAIEPPAGPLRAPGTVDLEDCPDLGPILCTLGLFCHGETRLTGSDRLRLKESDRVAGMQKNLAALGGDIRVEGDSIVIHGGKPLHLPHAPLDSQDDHRVVMALCVAGAAAGLPLQITGGRAVAKSWPGFFSDMKALGLDVEFDAA